MECDDAKQRMIVGECQEPLLIVSNGRAVRPCVADGERHMCAEGSTGAEVVNAMCQQRLNWRVHSLSAYKQAGRLQSGPNANVFVVRRRHSIDAGTCSRAASTLPLITEERDHADGDDMQVDSPATSCSQQIRVAEAANDNCSHHLADAHASSRDFVLKIAPRAPSCEDDKFCGRVAAEVDVLKRLVEPSAWQALPGDRQRSEQQTDELHKSRLHLALPREVWFEPDGRACMLFDRKPLDLYELMRRRKWRAFAVRKAGHIVRQICNALHCLHRCFDLVHNDVKPENILIDPDTLHCWLADFGATCAPQPTDDYDNSVATEYFVAPERMFCKPFDERCDAWSLGVLASELLHGKPTLCSLYDSNAWRRCLFDVLNNRDSSELLDRHSLVDRHSVLERLAPARRCVTSRWYLGYKRLLQRCLVVRPTNRCSIAELLQSKDRPLMAFLRPMTPTALAK